MFLIELDLFLLYIHKRIVYFCCATDWGFRFLFLFQIIPSRKWTVNSRRCYLYQLLRASVSNVSIFPHKPRISWSLQRINVGTPGAASYHDLADWGAQDSVSCPYLGRWGKIWMPVLCLTIDNGPQLAPVCQTPEEVDVLLWLFPPGANVRADGNTHSDLPAPCYGFRCFFTSSFRLGPNCSPVFHHCEPSGLGCQPCMCGQRGGQRLQSP